MGPANNSQSMSSFQVLSEDIFAPKCLSCHSGPNGSGGVDLSSYNSIVATSANLVVSGQPSASRLYTEVATGDMPDGGPPLSTDEIEAIGQWIQDGAPNGEFAQSPAPTATPTPANSPTPTPSPSATPVPLVPYATIQTNIFSHSCTQCHSGSSPDAGIDLSSYTKLFANRTVVVVKGSSTTSLVYEEIKRGAMPPGGSVSAANLALLAEWINQGANNP
jgi:mono/diheme cytochrome c family protein